VHKDVLSLESDHEVEKLATFPLLLLEEEKNYSIDNVFTLKINSIRVLVIEAPL
jgi:hypothetical protein